MLTPQANAANPSSSQISPFFLTDSAVLLGMGGLALLLEFRRRQAPRLAGVFLTD